MQVTTLDYDDYLGYVAIGRIESGRIKPGERVLLRAPRRHDGGVPRREAARLPGAQALRAGRGGRRRHLRRHRHGGPDRRRDHHRDRAPDDPAAARDRRADGEDAVHVEQRPVRGQGGQVRHLAQPARPPVQGAEVATSRCASRRPTSPDTFEVLGPRRAAPVGAHRDHAPRGLRADGLAAAGHLQDRRRAARSPSPTRRS